MSRYWKVSGPDPSSDHGNFVIIVRASEKSMAREAAVAMLDSLGRSDLAQLRFTVEQVVPGRPPGTTGIEVIYHTAEGDSHA